MLDSMTDQTLAVQADDEDPDFLMPDHHLELHSDADDVEVSDVTNMDDLQREDGQDTGEDVTE